MNYLHLTNDNDRDCIVMVDKITHIVALSSRYTGIYFTHSEKVFVKESPQEILKMIDEIKERNMHLPPNFAS